MSEPDDMMLIKAYCAGDDGAFGVLYSRYKKLLYGYLYNLLNGNTAEADEVFEETWVKVVDKLPSYRDQGKFSAWLFRLARNIFIDRVRKRRFEAVSLDSAEVPELPDWRNRPEADIEEREIAEAVREALAQLPEEQREVFLLRQQELSFREIAGVQQCSVNTVLGRMHYAVRTLRKLLTVKVNR